MMRLNKCYGMLEKILNRFDNSSTANPNSLPESKVDEYI